MENRPVDFDLVLWSMGITQGSIRREDVRQWFLARDVTDEQIRALVEALRPFHAATRKDP